MNQTKPLATVYDPRAVEPEILRMWLDGGYFHADPAVAGEAYSIVIPPPNVTGALHGGHALNNTLQDILTRWRRMQGRNTLWMPGTDHAGIATQAVVERTIFEKEGKSRHDLGREELVRRIWEWKEQYGNRILQQLELMGCSCDWARTRFTLDEVCARAVRHTFFRLFKDGLIVRGKRLVNWDTQLQTAVADDEVYHETVAGHFYHFKYPVKTKERGSGGAGEREKEPEFVHIATTRPETMLGDTAVAVHPEPDAALAKAEADLRASLAEAPEKDRAGIQAALDDIAERRRTLLPKLLRLRDMARAGRTLILPLVNREIPLICDVWAKPELGSGCVKITPAHDANDYEVGRRHGLAMVNVVTPDGRVARIVEPDGSVNPNSARYEGLRFATEGRKRVVEDLEAAGLVEKIEDRQIEIGHSDRSKTPIEPFLSDQWFVRMGDLDREEASRIEGLRGSSGLAQLAMDAVCQEQHASEQQRKRCGKVHFFPARYAKTYLDWLGEKRDWCISRQLWWGHRIPVWTRQMAVCEMYEPLSLLLDGNIEHARVSVRITHANGGSWGVFGGRNGHIHLPQEVDDWKQGDRLTWYVCPVDDELEITVNGRRQRFTDFLKSEGFTQDPDVLDTWFSSALWPQSTMGWPAPNPLLPEADKLLARYYPTDVLSTAREIITLWVARMVLTGRYNIGKVPFHDVYIHAVIQDSQGRPFKKTLGNGFDPVDIIEYYGADALRYTMAALSTETQDIRMPMKRVKTPDGRELQSSERFELGRNFCNKIWNAARFAFMTLSGAPNGARSASEGQRGARSASEGNRARRASEGVPARSASEGVTRAASLSHLNLAALPIEDRWILSRLSAAAIEVQDALEWFQFSRAATAARDFVWDALCDWYLELVKLRVREDRQADEARTVLAFVLDQGLRLLHPLIPFITETLWQQLRGMAPARDGAPALVIAAYPPAGGWAEFKAPDIEAVFADLQTATRAVRDIRQTRGVPPKQTADVTIRVPPGRVASLQREAHVIEELANVGRLTIDPNATAPRNAATLVIGDMEIFVHDVIDPAAERQRLEKELAGLDRQIAAVAGKLANSGFVSHAPAELVAQERQRLADLQAKRATVVRSIGELG